LIFLQCFDRLRVDGEINTDDLSPATEAWSRPDIPLHAQSMLVKKMDSPLKTIAQLKETFGNSFLLVNQSAFAQESTTCLAKVLLVDFSTML
jgi:aconitase B